MRPKLPILIAVAGIALLVVNGCATQSYVQTQISELQDQMEANRAEIAILKSSDTAQNEKLSELSDTVQDAISRVQQLREIAEGKFLYEITITDDPVVFDFDSSELSGETQKALDAFAVRLIEENKDCYVEIQGHTDHMGPEEYNFQLGLTRARAVMSYLYVQHGIPLNRMNTYSYGATKPIADNSIPSERVKNRRVSLVVMTQAVPFADAQAEKNSIPEDEYVEQDKESGPGLAAEDFISKELKNESEPGRALEDLTSKELDDVSETARAVENLTSKAVDKGFLIQVGAYRSLATAEKVLKVLQDKGYDAYLDQGTLPEIGLIHRVRIRGYTTNAAAKADVGRLQKEDGLHPIVLNVKAT